MTQTIELNGRPIAVMGGSHDEVEAFAEGGGFRNDLLTFFDRDGHPLWDGRDGYAPSVRGATQEEEAVFQDSFGDAVAADAADADDPADWLVFLVDVREAIEGDKP